MLEVGCGNGSMSVWIAEHIAPDGQIVALDLDLSLVDDVRAPTLSSLNAPTRTGGPRQSHLLPVHARAPRS